MLYVDGFVVPVPKRKLAEYRRMALKAGKVWREHGALEYRECVADDVAVGKRTSFPRSVKLKPGETVVLSWVVYKARAQRDRVTAKVMKDPRLASMMPPNSVPFDMKRMFLAVSPPSFACRSGSAGPSGAGLRRRVVGRRAF